MTDRVAGASSDLERRIRVGGVLLLAASLLVVLGADRYAQSNASGDLRWLYQVTTFSALALAPAGAMLVAVSVVVRGLARGGAASFRRGQLVVGLLLVAVGVLSMWRGSNGLAELEEFLGPTGRPGAFVLGLAAQAIALAALPLGLALLTLLPLYRLVGSDEEIDLDDTADVSGGALHEVE